MDKIMKNFSSLELDRIIKDVLRFNVSVAKEIEEYVFNSLIKYSGTLLQLIEQGRKSIAISYYSDLKLDESYLESDDAPGKIILAEKEKCEENIKSELLKMLNSFKPFELSLIRKFLENKNLFFLVKQRSNERSKMANIELSNNKANSKQKQKKLISELTLPVHIGINLLHINLLIENIEKYLPHFLQN